MKNLKNLMIALWKDESGQDMAEYALLLVLIAVIVSAAVIIFRERIVGAFTRAGTVLDSN